MSAYSLTMRTLCCNLVVCSVQCTMYNCTVHIYIVNSLLHILYLHYFMYYSPLTLHCCFNADIYYFFLSHQILGSSVDRSQSPLRLIIFLLCQQSKSICKPNFMFSLFRPLLSGLIFLLQQAKVSTVATELLIPLE